ncbi:MAG: diguanylate cyclase [Lachnospiraceae bacterium]|nr:diguanylate cyclase [Lachnospiraceae bacterium]MBR6486533.1 diguanylate cyclase [Lachnospiraceae bacterium]
MKLVHIKQIKGSRSLYGTFLYITLLPLVLFGVILMIYSSITLTRNIQTEVSSNLRNVCVAVLAAYDVSYEGDYNVMIVDGVVEFYKGDTFLSNDHTLLDNIKEDTDVDISMFFYDTRVLTTITDGDGNRFINTGANATILNTVVGKRTSSFYNNVYIGNGKYFAYYMPIISKDGLTCLGMIGAATPANGVASMVRSSVIRNILIMLLALLVTAWAIMHFTSEIIMIIKKIMKFLSEISGGDLNTELDPLVISRQDELGEMGRLTNKLRASLRKLIERDALTGIYNRRYGSKKLADLISKGIPYSAAIGDIDFFKKFNDKFGHDCGDAVLIEVAKTLSEHMRSYGFAARWGGEEFLLVFENISGMSATIACERVLDAVRERLVEHDGQYHSVTMSFGVTQGRPELTLDENINAADERLYEAKENGRNQVVGE